MTAPKEIIMTLGISELIIAGMLQVIIAAIIVVAWIVTSQRPHA
jgi:hypothetical protein